MGVVLGALLGVGLLLSRVLTLDIGSPACRGFLLCYRASMSVEFLFAVSIHIADQAARKRGWRPSGRAAWLKADGTMVCFICFEEQLAGIPAGARVHKVGG